MFESPFHFFQHHYGHPGDVEMVIRAAEDTLHAIEAIENGDRHRALELWKRVDGNALLELWNASARRCRELGPRWKLERPQPTASPDKPAGASIAKKVYQRDGYRCRYCGSPVFTRNKGSRILQLIGAFPEETRDLTLVGGSLRGSGKSGAICNADYAKFLWSLAAPDHVFPRSLGGRTDMDNLVTSCSGCNYSKMDLTLEQMDVRHPT
mgnify:FL=1